MNRIVKNTWLAVFFGVGMCVVPSSPAIGGDRTAEDILQEIDSGKLPTLELSKIRDQAYVREYAAKNNAFWAKWAKRDALILELFRVAPDHERIPTLMRERWDRMGSNAQMRGAYTDFSKDIEGILAHTKNRDLLVEGTYYRSVAKLSTNSVPGRPELSALDDFHKLAPKDVRNANLIATAAFIAGDTKTKISLADRLLEEYPNAPVAAMMKGIRRQFEEIGKPFDLEFTDAIKGSTVSIKGLKGKVVVIHFWATWWGACVSEMPHIKELYAKYRDQGVEFIGVSLDQPKVQGGLDALKKFVEETQIDWPQYYQGKSWQSEFSNSWGIYSIPALFVVDTEGSSTRSRPSASSR
jgi:thiol-disulfide isomerase/thioredoxin